MENLLVEAVRHALKPNCWVRSNAIVEEVRNYAVGFEKPFSDIDPAMVHPVLNMFFHHKVADRREAFAISTELHGAFGRSAFEYIALVRNH